MIRTLRSFKKVSRYWFSEEEKKYPKVIFDEEKINKKIEDLRANKFKAEMPVNPDLMPDYTIPLPNKELIKRREARGNANIMSFVNPGLEEKPTNLLITSFTQQAIAVDNFDYIGSLIITKNQVLVWEVVEVSKLTIADFIILKYLSPKPTFILLGAHQPQLIPKDVIEFVQDAAEIVEIGDLFQSISQFNTMSTDDIECIAFLLVK